MFQSLSERLNKTFKNITGRGRLTESNIQDSMREVRVALLEADVALPVVKQFITDVKEKALGQDVVSSLDPGQALIKIVNDELVHVMGDVNESLNLHTTPPAVVLMAGLQGSGKTTSVAKLARYLKEREKKKVCVVSADIYRPAAIDQLETLAKEVEVEFFPSKNIDDPVTIAKNAITHAKNHYFDVLLIDTAGRTSIDETMMAEIKALHTASSPIETLLVVDSMTGQDAAHTAKHFHDTLPLTGVILTKADGDARGGAALSMRYITGKPIKFLGIGEKTDALEPFFPDRVASRILGMGDVLSLIEEVERKVDKKKSEKLAKKIKKGKGFDLEDFRDQLLELEKMGGMMGMLNKIPGMGKIPQAALNQVSDKKMNHTVALINSMTKRERKFPKLIDGSRKKRIARGAGLEVVELNKLLKQYTQMQKMMKKMSKPGAMQKMMKMMGNMPGGMPNNMF